jgi:hypothetical protein
MKRLFDPEIIRAQIENLKADRDRIDQAILSLESALRNIERFESGQVELPLATGESDMTLHDVVKKVCINMIDGITRQRVINAIEQEHPFLKPKSPSVAASLINLTKGDRPMLNVAIEGRGRSPSFYSTQVETVHRLSADEIKELTDEKVTRGTGGWQSLFAGLQRNFNKTKGEITLTSKQRAMIYHYYRSYGGGGWQETTRRIFRRELPHLFVS